MLSKPGDVISTSKPYAQHCLLHEHFTKLKMVKETIQLISFHNIFMKRNRNALAYNKKIIESVIWYMHSFFLGLLRTHAYIAQQTQKPVSIYQTYIQRKNAMKRTTIFICFEHAVNGGKFHLSWPVYLLAEGAALNKLYVRCIFLTFTISSVCQRCKYFENLSSSSMEKPSKKLFYYYLQLYKLNFSSFQYLFSTANITPENRELAG